MNIIIFCDNATHPIMPFLRKFVHNSLHHYDIKVVNKLQEVKSGNLLFLVSCSTKVSQTVMASFQKTLVIHASDLPYNRGWSPHVWELLEGAEKLTISLLEASDKIDAGDILMKKEIIIPKHFLYDEINQVLFETELELIDWAIKNYASVVPKKQDLNVVPTYRRMRTPSDSELDVNKTLSELFNLLRISDPFRYPAFFFMNGYKYKLTIEKMSEDSVQSRND